MRIVFKISAAVFLLFLAGWSLAGAQEKAPSDKPFYEYKGNYGEEVKALKGKFLEKFGYELADFGRNWAPEEIRWVHVAFEQFPPSLYRLPGLKALYRLEHMVLKSRETSTEDIPAATLPSFSPIYENASQSYKVFVEKQDLRVEFYNPLFYEDRPDLINIIQHEMAHAFDFANGFLSFSDEWLALAKFRVLHIFALDAERDSDFLFALVNDPQTDNYAPVSTRNLPTYSRQNPQEDFANSVTAYIHYPYFRYTHPKRYRFLKERVFGGKEYFPGDSGGMGFEERVLADLEKALQAGAWADARAIFVELSRGYYPELERKIVKRIEEGMGTVTVSSEKDRTLGLGLCFLKHPDSLKLRRNLIRAQRLTVQMFLKDSRCFRMARDAFEKGLSKWPPANLYFFRENERDIVQFMDPVLATAHARGFDTDYFWRVFIDGGGGRPLAEGRMGLEEGGNGSVQIDLKKSAFKPFVLPEGRVLRLELGARRMHPRTFKTFESQKAPIRFVVRSGLRYRGPHPPGVRVIYPQRPSH